MLGNPRCYLLLQSGLHGSHAEKLTTASGERADARRR
jgi:hypothetical protein